MWWVVLGLGNKREKVGDSQEAALQETEGGNGT
jgi:hypothetical protein